jgi:hypothetical protein
MAYILCDDACVHENQKIFSDKEGCAKLRAAISQSGETSVCAHSETFSKKKIASECEVELSYVSDKSFHTTTTAQQRSFFALFIGPPSAY